MQQAFARAQAVSSQSRSGHAGGQGQSEHRDHRGATGVSADSLQAESSPSAIRTSEAETKLSPVPIASSFKGDLKVVWDALFDHAESVVLVTRPAGDVLAVNERGRAVFGLADSEDVSLRVLFAPPLATEVESIVRDVDREQSASSVQLVTRGNWLTLALRPCDYQGEPAVLLVGTRGHAEGEALSDEVRRIRARNDDLGELAALTPRELEILRLIGLGLSTNDIAKVLFRSVKTVEGHRVSLGSKLKISNRVELARIALRCGLITLDTPLPVIADEVEA